MALGPSDQELQQGAKAVEEESRTDEPVVRAAKILSAMLFARDATRGGNAQPDYMTDDVVIRELRARISELNAKLEIMLRALQSIAANSCCTPCLEAGQVARVALAALKRHDEL